MEWVHEKAVATKSSIDENNFGTVKLSQTQPKKSDCGVGDKVCVLCVSLGAAAITTSFPSLIFFFMVILLK
jgi:hypothetical protein